MHDLTLPQDPNELFDVVLSDGTPTGLAKTRADVHRDGDWHRALHVWVVGIDDRGPFLTFQRRSMAKDTLPGMLDATVGGHFRAGEGLEETIREVEEEIGVAVGLDRLTWVGRRICVHEGTPGAIDHELQEVFLLRDDGPLTQFIPSPAELESLARFQLRDLLEYLAGDRAEIHGIEMRSGTTTVEPATFGRDSLRQRADRYFYRVAIAAERLLAGERHVAI